MGPVDVAIVGGGASGTLVAVQLLRQAPGPWRIALIERSGALARGLAYGPAEPCHLLNVPAGGMSAFPDDAGHFVRWTGAAPEAFLPRGLYGTYLEKLLTEAHARAAPGVRTPRSSCPLPACRSCSCPATRWPPRRTRAA